jgi:chromosome segregation ATPase
MEFNQPTSAPMNKETEAQIVALRVQISDREAEINRLDGIINSNKYTIQQLSNQKADLEDFVKNAAKTSDLLTKEVEGLNVSLGEVKTELESARNELTKTKIDINNRLVDIKAKEKVMEESIEDLQKQKEEANLKRAELDIEKKELDSKIEQLKSIIK